MILPDKYVRLDRSLLGQSATILKARSDGQTVSALWNEVRSSGDGLAYERFILSLDLLFMLGCLEINKGVLDWKLP